MRDEESLMNECSYCFQTSARSLRPPIRDFDCSRSGGTERYEKIDRAKFQSKQVLTNVMQHMEGLQ
jgi:hypothetical protein